MRLLVLPIGLLALFACNGGGGGDIVVSDINDAPTCDIAWPAEDGEILEGASFDLSVTISDDSPVEAWSMRVVSDLDGIFPGTATFDDFGGTLTVLGDFLRQGYHTLSVTVGDEDAQGTCARSFYVVPNQQPSAAFSSPSSAGTYLSSENVLVELNVFDPDETDQSVLALEWSGIAAGQPTAPATPDSDGQVSWFLPRLPAGSYTIGVNVTDPVGASRSAAVTFEVIPTDGDNDGWISAGDGGQDCDDTAFAVNPGQLELCNGIDDDCDGEVDESDAFAAPEWFADLDQDGFGDDATRVVQCTAPAGHITVGGDCDDGDVDIHPGADEVCDGADEDCNGIIDDAPLDGSAYYADVDGDTFGDAGNPTTACVPGPGVSTNGADCDDSNDLVYPGSTEVCGNAIDDDCNGGIDDSCFIDHCGDIFIAEVWAGGAIHRVSCPLNVQSTLTILDGAIVEFEGDDAVIEVAQNGAGRLMVQGGSSGVLFRPRSADREGGIVFGPWDTGSVLEGFTFTSPHPTRPAIVVDAPRVELRDFTLQDGAVEGLWVSDGASVAVEGGRIEAFEGDGLVADGLLESLSNTVITGNLGVPLRIKAQNIPQIGATNDLTGNWVDEIEVSGGDVREDTTWGPASVPYVFTQTVEVGSMSQPTLTLLPGTEISFATGRGIEVGTLPGRLFIDAASDPVILNASSLTQLHGDWGGLYFGEFDTGSSLTGIEVLHAGGSANAAIRVENTTLHVASARIHRTNGVGIRHVGTVGGISLTDSTITDATSHGIYLGQETPDLLAFDGNTITGNGGAPFRGMARHFGSMTVNNTVTGNDQDYIWGWSSVTRDARWVDLGVPYRIPLTAGVGSGEQPILTLADGVVVEFTGRGSFGISDGGLVIEQGGQGVLFTSGNDVPAPGDWEGVSNPDWGRGDLSDLRGLTIEFAGGAPEQYGLLAARSELVIDGLTIRHSLGAGLRVGVNVTPTVRNSSFVDNEGPGIEGMPNSSFAAFDNNLIAGNAFAADIDHNAVSALDTDNTYTGNDLDVVRINGGELLKDATFRDNGVPWLIAAPLIVRQSTPVPNVTIEAGAELRFGAGASLQLGADGGRPANLTVLGTPSDPVWFTSDAANPAPGDWQGIRVDGAGCDVDITNAIIEFAGSEGDGALTIRDPGNHSVSDTTIRDSAAYGVWATSGNVPALSGVTYSNNALGDTFEE